MRLYTIGMVKFKINTVQTDNIILTQAIHTVWIVMSTIRIIDRYEIYRNTPA